MEISIGVSVPREWFAPASGSVLERAPGKDLLSCVRRGRLILMVAAVASFLGDRTNAAIYRYATSLEGNVK